MFSFRVLPWRAVRYLLGFGLTIIGAVAVLAAPSASAVPASSPDWNPPALPAPALPDIPARTVRLSDCGAVADGHTLATAAFARAIEAVAAQGGGRVVVPAGVWLTGPIVLRSRVELHLERGALVQFTDQRDAFPLVEGTYEGARAWRCQSPLSGQDLEHVAITGAGIIDGAGQAWRPVKKDKMTEAQWKKLVASGGVVDAAGRIWYPSEAARRGNEQPTGRRDGSRAEAVAVRDALRPVMVSLVNCRRVLLQGVTFQNSPAWCVHPLLCTDLTVRGVTVRNPWYAQNGDGIDVESCASVLIEDSSFDVGDDAICLKSGRDAEGRRRGRPTENVRVQRCTVYHGHGGFVVGSEMSGGVRNVIVTDCTFLGTDVGLRFKSQRGRGGVVENIWIRDVRMTGIPQEALLFDLFYMTKGGAKAEEVPPVTEATPAFRRIWVRDVVCRGAGRAAKLQGLPEMPLVDFHLANAVISAREGILLADAAGVTLTDVDVRAEKGPAMVIKDAREVAVAGWKGGAIER